jgi:hypothetical protein
VHHNIIGTPMAEMGQTLPSRDFCGTSALPLKPDIGWRGWYVRKVADCVAKLFAALRKSNFRIRLNRVLNRRCAPVLVLESILLNLVAKIVLQHNRHKADVSSTRSNVPSVPSVRRRRRENPRRLKVARNKRSLPARDLGSEYPRRACNRSRLSTWSEPDSGGQDHAPG